MTRYELVSRRAEEQVRREVEEEHERENRIHEMAMRQVRR